MGPIEVLVLSVVLIAGLVIGGAIILGLWVRREDGDEYVYELDQDYAATIDLMAQRQKELTRRVDELEAGVSSGAKPVLDAPRQREWENLDNDNDDPPRRQRRVR